MIHMRVQSTSLKIVTVHNIFVTIMKQYLEVFLNLETQLNIIGVTAKNLSKNIIRGFTSAEIFFPLLYLLFIKLQSFNWRLCFPINITEFFTQSNSFLFILAISQLLHVLFSTKCWNWDETEYGKSIEVICVNEKRPVQGTSLDHSIGASLLYQLSYQGKIKSLNGLQHLNPETTECSIQCLFWDQWIPGTRKGNKTRWCILTRKYIIDLNLEALQFIISEILHKLFLFSNSRCFIT